MRNRSSNHIQRGFRWGMPALRVLSTLAIILLLSTETLAHRPLFTSPRTTEPESAVRVADPATSHVIYAELTESDPVQWFVFENEKAQEVPILIGVPAGVSPDDFRPAVVLFAPGSGPPDTFSLPAAQGENVGTIAIDPDGDPEDFYEPITGTDSKILIETHVQLQETGTYYGAIYEPDGRTGKLWVGIGKSEGFSWRDALRLPGWIGDVRQFHEVSGWPPWAWIGTMSLLAIGLGVIAWVRLRKRARAEG